MNTSNDYALAIGIAHYPHLEPLDGPIIDAERFADWLETAGGLPSNHVKRIMSCKSAMGQPILQQIDDALDEILNQAENLVSIAAIPPRRLYVYFAGHGCSQEYEHVALIMANAKPGSFNASMNAQEYRKALAHRTFPEQLYLFDCCRRYDPATRGRGPELTPDPGDQTVANLVQIVMYAAGFKETAFERRLQYDTRRGLFTEALMEGLSGAASRRGHITSNSLSSYVSRRVDDLTTKEKVGHQQNFASLRYGDRPLILASGTQDKYRQATVIIPRGTTRLVVTDEQGEIIATKGVASRETDTSLELPLIWQTIEAMPGGEQETINVLPGESPKVVDLRSKTT